jgi:hypothetical protein
MGTGEVATRILFFTPMPLSFETIPREPRRLTSSVNGRAIIPMQESAVDPICHAAPIDCIGSCAMLLSAAMTSQLDFIVFGPGRSGTTAFARAFNAHPQIFCAIEFLPPKADHSEFRMPEDLLRLHLADTPVKAKSMQILREKLLRGDVSAFGNKMPNYYFQLERLRRELPNLKLFYIYRSPLEFVHSWDRRAEKEGDRWPAGRLGIFGIIEQIFCLKRMASLPFDVSMVSYRSLFFDDSHLMRSIVERLGVNADGFDQQNFEKAIFQKYKPKPPGREEFYGELFEEFRFDRIDAYFEANPLSQSSSEKFAECVSKQFDNVPPPSKFAKFLQKVDPAAPEFSVPWRRQLRMNLDNRESPASQWLLKYVKRANKHLEALAAPKSKW